VNELERVKADIVSLIPRLRRFARSLTRHVHDADDLVQLALERALARLDSWQPGSRLDSWMFTIVRNAWIDEVRLRTRRGDGGSIEALLETAAAPASGIDDALSIERAMARLPEEQRSAVLLVLVEGLPYREAAAVLGIPIGTLTSRLARGRDALQALLGDPPGATT
jgi:RNA polymerase sigma-70 factor (ECF subfamily)